MSVQPESVEEVTKFRRRAGYAVLLTSLVLILVFLAVSLWQLEGIVAPYDELHERFALVRIGAHVFVTVAAIYYFYQLAKLGERLARPPWLPPESETLRSPVETLGELAAYARDVVKKDDAPKGS